METNWAAEHLQVIRTLMERSALYRRALAPVMLFTGVLGVLAAIVGCVLQIGAPRAFVAYWLVVALVTLAGSLSLVRRQALKAAEAFWSPPTRRVTQALLPPLAAGFALGITVVVIASGDAPLGRIVSTLWLPLLWVVLYGCAMSAAGFFMHRGIKLFGYVFVLGGCGLFPVGVPEWVSPLVFPHGIMGLFFGVLHLAYGIYLYFTEKRRNEP